MNRERNELQYDNLVYDIVHSMFRSKAQTRRLKAISGKMISGEVYFCLSDHYESTDAFVNILSGLVPKSTNTYGYITYNGIERVWIDWSRRCRVLDLTTALDFISFPDYLERDIKFTFPHLNIEERKAKFRKIVGDIENVTGMEIGKSDYTSNISLIIYHILQAPEILIIKNFLKLDTEDNFAFLRSTFLDFVQANNSILILSDVVDKQMLQGVFHYTYNFGTALWIQDGELIYSGKTNDYKNQMSLIGSGAPLRDVTLRPEILGKALRKIRNRNYEKILSLNLDSKLTSSNNLDVSLDTISLLEIFSLVKKRLSSFNTSLVYLFALITSIFIVLCYVFFDILHIEKRFDDILPDIKSAKGSDAFFIAAIFYIANFNAFVPSLAILCPSELLISEDYSSDFVMGTISPYNFIIARLITYNLPVYIINVFVILLSWCFEFRKYINFLTAIFMVLISFVYTFFFHMMFNFVKSAFESEFYTIVFSAWYLFCSWWVNLREVANEFSISGKFSLAYIVYLDPYFIFTVFLEVGSLKHALLSEKEHFYRKLYLDLRYSTVEVFKNYYEVKDNDLLDHNDLRPTVLYSLLRLPESNLSIKIMMGLLVGLFIISSLIFGKKKVVPNVRLKLIKNNK